MRLNPKRKTILTRLGRICSFLFLGVVVLMVLVYLVFRLNKGRIERELLRIAHTYQAGEIRVEDIDISFFAQFPKVSLKLEDVTYYEHRASERNPEEQPVAELENIFVAVEILKLLKGDIVVNELALKQGRIDLIKYPDKSVNLLNAVGIDPVDDEKAAESSSPVSPGVLNLLEVTLEDVYLSYDNAAEDYRVDLLVHHLYNYLSIEKPYLDCHMAPDLKVLGIRMQDREWLKDIGLGMTLDFRFDLENQIGQIAPSELEVESAKVGVKGSFDLSDEGFLDIKFDSLINDASLLSLVFEEELLSRNKANLQKGEVFLKGYVKGRIQNHFPSIELTFGANDLHLDVPESSGPIQDLDFRGFFATGEAQDLSEARIRITDLSAVLPGGSLTGSLDLKNLRKPELSLHCDGKADIQGFNNIFKIDILEDLRGTLALEADVQGTIDFENENVLSGAVNAELNFTNVAFRLPEWNKTVDRLNGVMNISKDSFGLKDLFVQTGGSDVLLNGDVSGVIAHLQDRKTDIRADVRIRSDLLRLSDLEASGAGSNQARDEELSELEADLKISTSSDGLSDFALLPLGSIVINKLSAGLRNFADINSLSGTLDVSRDSIRADGFQAKIGMSDIRLSADLQNPGGLTAKDKPVDMALTFELDSDLFQVNDVFTYREKTYLPESLTDEVFRGVHLKGELRINNQELFAGKQIPNFHLKLNEVDWKLAAFPNPFEDLGIDISAQDDDLIIRNVQGRFGKNDFAINGKIEDVLLPAGERDVTRRTTLHLGSRHLNLSELNELFVSPGQGEEGNREGSWDLPPLHLSLDIDSLLWGVLSAENISGELHTRGLTKIILHPEDKSVPGLTADFNGSIQSENLLLPDFEIPRFSMQFSGKDRLYDLEPSLETVLGTRGTGNIHLDFSRPERAVRIQYKVENFLIRRLLRLFEEEPSITGQMDLFIGLTAIGNDKDALNSSLTGRVVLDGHELTLHGIDIDDLLAKFKRSQRFNLVDLGAYMMAGPVGAVATKGFDFASLLKLDPSAKSAIPRFTSHWDILNGVAEASDVAMITNKSRVAIKGGIDFPRKRFQDLAFAVVDSKGCALVSQSINGPFENPEISGIRAVEALLAPVFNIFKIAAFGDCPRFYSGSLGHPTK